MEEIKNDPKHCKLFNHRNQKYKLEDLLECVIIVFKLGISYRNIQPYTKIHWNTCEHSSHLITVYKFYLKLIKTDIIEKTFIKYKNIYVNDTNSIIKCIYTDTKKTVSLSFFAYFYH